MSLKSSLIIKAGFKSAKTFLKESYFTAPLKVIDITEDKTGNPLRLMIMSSSPGVLDNDKYTINIDLEDNASLWLTTQGYQRIFKMKTDACQEVSIKLGDHASFVYLPHPVVPHEDADFTSINNIILRKNHRLIWSEIITCGRKHSGEVFKFKRYKNKTKIFIDGKLAVLENVLLEPATRAVQAMGQLEGFSHQLSFIVLDNSKDMQLIAEEINNLLTLEDDISFGTSALAVNGLMIRILGFKSEQLFKLQNNIAELIAVSAQSSMPVEALA